MDRIHFAFRPSGQGAGTPAQAYVGGHSSYQVRVWGAGLDALAGGLDARGGLEVSARGAPAGAGLRLGASQVSRGDEPLSSARELLRPDAAGGLERPLGSGLVERLRNTAQGVEQSWHVAARPEGRGALEVRVPVAQGRLVQETLGGLHFATAPELGGSAPSGTGAAAGLVRYGHGTWIDGAGRRTAIPARFERGLSAAGDIVLSVPESVLAASSYPAVLDPLVGPEVGIDVPTAGAAREAQSLPSVAWNGTLYLVVWEDGRNGSDFDIIGARVSAAGALLDASGIAVAVEPGDQRRPKVASDGADFLVVWEDARGGDADLYGARVTELAEVLDAHSVPLATGPALQGQPALAFGGGKYLVAWEQTGSVSDGGLSSDGGPREDKDLYAARLETSGGALTVLDVGGVALSAAAGPQEQPAIAFDGEGFLVLWQDLRSAAAYDLYGARMTLAGTLEPAAEFLLTDGGTGEWVPSVAFGQEHFVVAWEDDRNTPGGGSSERDLFAGLLRFDAGEPVFQEQPLATQPLWQEHPTVAFDGQRFFVAWQDHRGGADFDIYGAHLALDGGALELLDPAGLPLSTATNWQTRPALAWNGNQFFAVWQDFRAGGDIYGARVERDGGVVEPSGMLVSTRANRQRAPALAATSTHAVMVWQDFRSGAGDELYAARFASDGGLLDPLGLRLAGPEQNPGSPSVAASADGTQFLVAWQERTDAGEDIYARRLSLDGGSPDPFGFPVAAFAEDQTSPQVASRGGGFWVAFEDNRSGSKDILVAPVADYGGVGTPIEVAGGSEEQTAPALAYGLGQTLLVWQSAPSASADAGVQLLATRLGADGGVLDGTGLALAGPLFERARPAVASDGQGWLVAWTDDTAGASEADVRACRMSVAGVRLDPFGGFPLSSASGRQARPALAYDGTYYVAAWEDSRGGGKRDIYAARLTRGGSVKDLAGVPVAVAPEDEWGPAVAALPVPGGRYTVVAYARHGSPAGTSLAVERVLARPFGSNAVPTATTASLSGPEDAELPVTLAGQDSDGDALTFSVVGPPVHGTLAGTPPALRYLPAADFNGTDSLTFKVSDGRATSEVAVVALKVTPVNDAPKAEPKAVETDGSAPVKVTLSGSDVEGQTLSFSVKEGPANGTLTGQPPALTYQAKEGFAGDDAFTYVANDGVASSAPATVKVTVRSVPGSPDAGVGPAAKPPACGCTSGQGPAALALLFAVGRWLTGRRRRP